MIGRGHVVTAHAAGVVTRDQRAVRVELLSRPNAGTLLEQIAAEQHAGSGLVPGDDSRAVRHDGFGRKLSVGCQRGRFDTYVDQRAVAAVSQRGRGRRRFGPAARRCKVRPRRARHRHHSRRSLLGRSVGHADRRRVLRRGATGDARRPAYQRDQSDPRGAADRSTNRGEKCTQEAHMVPRSFALAAAACDSS